LTTITDSFVNVNVREDGFTAVNIKPIAVGDAVEKYYMVNWDTMQMVQIGNRTITQAVGLYMGTSRIVNVNETFIVISEQLMGNFEVSDAYILELYEIPIPEQTVPDFTPEVNYTTTDLKENLFFEGENMLKWVSFSQDENKTVIRGIYYDPTNATHAYKEKEE